MGLEIGLRWCVTMCYIFNIKVTETPAGGGLKTDVETYVADWDEILLSPGYE